MLVTISTLAERRIVRFPPLGGCREGFHRLAYSSEMADKPLPAKTQPRRTFPREGIKESSEHQQLRNNHSRDTCPHGSL